MHQSGDWNQINIARREVAAHEYAGKQSSLFNVSESRTKHALT
jgi:hypothetical protein